MSIRALLRSREIYTHRKPDAKDVRESAGCLEALWQLMVRPTQAAIPPTRNVGPTSAPSGTRPERPVILHDRKSNLGAVRETRLALTELGEPPSLESQIVTARKFDLPTSFKEARSEPVAPTTTPWKQSDFPKADQEFYGACTAAQLDAFTQFSIKEHSAENMFFLMASEKLLVLLAGSEQRKNLARSMLEAFAVRSAPLEPNLDGSNRKKVAAALAALARGEAPEKLEEVFKDARANLLKSVGSDSYKRFLQKLPA